MENFSILDSTIKDANLEGGQNCNFLITEAKIVKTSGITLIRNVLKAAP